MTQPVPRTADTRHRLAPVALWMTGALVSFVGAALSIRVLSRHLDVFEINMIRTGGGLCVLACVLVVLPHLLRDIHPRRLAAHLPRNAVHALGGMFWTLAIAQLPLATVFSLEFTAPAWAALLAFPVLGERIRLHSIAGIAACMVGVLIILRPDPATFDGAALLPLAAAFCFGLTVLLTRRLTRTETTFAILFWMMAIQFALNAVGAIASPHGGAPRDLTDPTLLGAGAMLVVSGLLSQLCLSKALQIGEAIVVLSIDFMRVPLIAAIGYLIFDEPLDAWVFAGFAVIALGITTGLVSQARRVEESAAG